ncbi:conserved hypothetical protein [Altererythrobacter sp. B11]|uniref:DUF4112 domain-containing protein n=1 Tax=Altererythrobacter sp. B11 TaxID=2060312 RepID=UPI000DC73A99|nr:DUF4112 domain-containing protein [Altererythrobacter sp. B11]BBC71620.1 conserved hypothetical protein [Altererythrobacter sp. B11]
MAKNLDHAEEVVRPRAMGRELPLGRDAHSVRQRVEAMERLLERSIAIPGTGRAIGLDAVLGLVPVAGDLLAAALGSYLIWEGRNLGMSRWQLGRMAGNLAFDTAVGAVPLAGDLFDFLFRSNTRNLRIIKRHLDKHHPVIDGTPSGSGRR